MSQPTLFEPADYYHGDPLRPGLEEHTPAAVVAEMNMADRLLRLSWLTTQAREILDAAEQACRGRRKVVARCILWSGGNDSNTLAHLMRPYATHAIHANTGIGIEQTRQHVRDACAAWGLPLIEKRAGDAYRQLVLGQMADRKGNSVWQGGFPGPGAHWLMYQRLKERCLDAARHDLGVANSKSKMAVFIAGRRREESKRRADVPLYEKDGSVIWASPIAMWTKLDINLYRQLNPDVPHNEVSDLLHMSGECLCGAFAHRGELDEIGDWYPDVRDEILALEQEAIAAGIPEPRCHWGWGANGTEKPSETGRLCTTCASRYEGDET